MLVPLPFNKKAFSGRTGMYIRYVTDRVDDDTGVDSGVFSAAYDILDGTEIDDYCRTEIRTTLRWFNTNLPKPSRLRRSRKPNGQNRGVCWFKSNAIECMANIRYLAFLVKEQDIIVREIVTNSPGYIVYEDDFQIVAEPFADTPQ